MFQQNSILRADKHFDVTGAGRRAAAYHLGNFLIFLSTDARKQKNDDITIFKFSRKSTWSFRKNIPFGRERSRRYANDRIHRRISP